MKPFNAFVQLFTVFAFLTLGSFFILLSLHLLSLEDAMIKLQLIYSNGWESLQIGLTGLLFVTVGLFLARNFIKYGREEEILVIHGEAGPIVVSVYAIDDIARKILKKFHLVKDAKVKTIVRGNKVAVQLRLVLWSMGRMGDLLASIQEEVRMRVRKIIGEDASLEIRCEVREIQNHDDKNFEPQSNDFKQLKINQK